MKRSAREIEERPWAEHGILKLERVKRWEIFIDQRKQDLIWARLASLRAVRVRLLVLALRNTLWP